MLYCNNDNQVTLNNCLLFINCYLILNRVLKLNNIQIHKNFDFIALSDNRIKSILLDKKRKTM